ncbi:hypothetical protein BDW69DRAFT_176974 [Aspergillus filifer]
MRVKNRMISALAFAPFLPFVHAAENTTCPIRDTELGDKTVQWDHYSLIYNGQRLFSFGGEFNPFRLPVPEILVDVMEKIKAMGMGTVSFYSQGAFTRQLVIRSTLKLLLMTLERFMKLPRILVFSYIPGPALTSTGKSVPVVCHFCLRLKIMVTCAIMIPRGQ